jgi:hypothetical protein
MGGEMVLVGREREVVVGQWLQKGTTSTGWLLVS